MSLAPISDSRYTKLIKKAGAKQTHDQRKLLTKPKERHDDLQHQQHQLTQLIIKKDGLPVAQQGKMHWNQIEMPHKQTNNLPKIIPLAKARRRRVNRPAPSLHTPKLAPQPTALAQRQTKVRAGKKPKPRSSALSLVKKLDSGARSTSCAKMTAIMNAKRFAPAVKPSPTSKQGSGAKSAIATDKKAPSRMRASTELPLYIGVNGAYAAALKVGPDKSARFKSHYSATADLHAKLASGPSIDDAFSRGPCNGSPALSEKLKQARRSLLQVCYKIDASEQSVYISPCDRTACKMGSGTKKK